MPFNLITTRWLPVRRLSGRRDWIGPANIADGFADDPILALDSPRPDWNPAVTELLIGMLAVVMAPASTEAWAELWAAPPTPEELARRLERIAFAFDLDGDGPRCFQDRDPLADCDEKPIAAMLIDAPGENAERKNTDLFVKRADAFALCPAYAAAALATLQTYAPAGGQGNRTSLRGGGPLTTLALPRRKIVVDGHEAVATTLWDAVWANVPLSDRRNPVPDAQGATEWHGIFLWLAPTRTSEKNRATLPEHGHPLQHFFGMPRRIRLEFSAAGDAQCALGGASDATLVRAWRQQNYGVKYEGWEHPLSPHRSDDKVGKLPFHPQPGGATYRDWLSWVQTPTAKETQRAASLDAWGARIASIRDAAAYPDGEAFKAADGWQSSVLACGFDMDNMKARGWLEARIPYFDPPKGSADAATWASDFRASTALLVAGAEKAADALRSNIKIALTGKLNREGRWRADENLPRDAYADLVERLWRQSERGFRDALRNLRDGPDDTSRDVRRGFSAILRQTALTIFDEMAGTDDLATQNARRIVEARSMLLGAFGETGSVSSALGIASEEAKQRRSAKRKGGKDDNADKAAKGDTGR